MTVIDLGYREPTAASPARQRRPQLRRKAAAVLVAALCIASVTASAPVAAPRGLRILWQGTGIPMDNPRTIAGPVVAAFTDMPSGRLVAYGLRDGRVRWSRTMAGAVDVTSVADAGVVVVSSVATGDVSVRITALDAATGTERWRATGPVLTTTRSTVLLAEPTPDGLGYAGVRVLDGADGRVRWQRELPGMSQWSWLGPDAGSPESLVTVAGQSGIATVDRWSDGSEIARGPIDSWPGPRSRAGTEATVATTGISLLVTVQSDQAATFTVYGAEQGWHRRWQFAGGPDASMNDCGVVICVGEAGQLTGYDPVSGQVRWRAADVDYATGPAAAC